MGVQRIELCYRVQASTTSLVIVPSIRYTRNCYQYVYRYLTVIHTDGQQLNPCCFFIFLSTSKATSSGKEQAGLEPATLRNGYGVFSYPFRHLLFHRSSLLNYCSKNFYIFTKITAIIIAVINPQQKHQKLNTNCGLRFLLYIFLILSTLDYSSFEYPCKYSYLQGNCIRREYPLESHPHQKTAVVADYLQA